APTVEFESMVPTAYLARCVDRQLRTVWSASRIRTHNSGGETVYIVSHNKSGFVGGGIIVTVAITPKLTFSHVALREGSHIEIGSGYEKTRAAIRFCGSDEFSKALMAQFSEERQIAEAENARLAEQNRLRANRNAKELPLKRTVGTRICRIQENGWEAIG